MAAPASDGPRVRVAAVVPAPGGIVVVMQHKGASSYALLPGGGVSAGETLEEALIREVEEETGLSIAIDQLLFVNDSIAPDGSKHVVNLTFLARPVSTAGPFTPRDPAVDSVAIVPLDVLQSLDLRPPIASEIAAALSTEPPPFGARYLGTRWVDAGAAGGVDDVQDFT